MIDKLENYRINEIIGAIDVILESKPKNKIRLCIVTSNSRIRLTIESKLREKGFRQTYFPWVMANVKIDLRCIKKIEDAWKMSGSEFHRIFVTDDTRLTIGVLQYIATHIRYAEEDKNE